MKTQSNNRLTSLSKTQVQILTTQVAETLATTFGNSQSKTFSSADLWNIQRRTRSTLIR